MFFHYQTNFVHNLNPVFGGVCVARSLVFCVVFCISLFDLLFCFFWSLYCLSCFFWSLYCLFFFFWSLYCLSFFWSLYCLYFFWSIVCPSSFGHCIVCPSSFGHCIVCPSSIYGFWLTLLVFSNFSWQNTTKYITIVMVNRYVIFINFLCSFKPFFSFWKFVL